MAHGTQYILPSSLLDGLLLLSTQPLHLSFSSQHSHRDYPSGCERHMDRSCALNHKPPASLSPGSTRLVQLTSQAEVVLEAKVDV